MVKKKNTAHILKDTRQRIKHGKEIIQNTAKPKHTAKKWMPARGRARMTESLRRYVFAVCTPSNTRQRMKATSVSRVWEYFPLFLCRVLKKSTRQTPFLSLFYLCASL
jgi:hypothetical protein